MQVHTDLNMTRKTQGKNIAYFGLLYFVRSKMNITNF